MPGLTEGCQKISKGRLWKIPEINEKAGDSQLRESPASESGTIRFRCLLTCLLRTEHEIHAGRVAEVVAIAVVSGEQARQTGQVVIRADRPEGHMLADHDIESA